MTQQQEIIQTISELNRTIELAKPFKDHFLTNPFALNVISASHQKIIALIQLLEPRVESAPIDERLPKNETS